MTASLADLQHGQQPLQVVPPVRLVPEAEGLLQIHTAPFRGSFAAVFSQALRSAGLGSRVLVSQFLKGGVEQGTEGSLWLCGRLQWLRPAMARCLEQPVARPAGRVGSPAANGEHDEEIEALDAVRQVWEFSARRLLEGDVDLLVLDELGLAIALGYLEAEEVVASLERRPHQVDVILTGPAIPPALMDMADQVTELRRSC
jgi:cob(I)alamin adenosyltransferase